MNFKPEIIKVNFIQKFIYCFFAFAGLPFLIVFIVVAFIDLRNGQANKILETIALISYVSITFTIILSAITWQIIDLKNRNKEEPKNWTKLIRYCLLLCRYFLAALIMSYGFQKLLIDQLQMHYYWYGDELGKLTGMQLTWSFFGYSKFYSSAIAVAQIIGGSLLLFRRTALIGAIFLFPVLVNIAMIDFVYDINAKDIITVLLLMDIFLIIQSVPALISFFIWHRNIPQNAILEPYTVSLNNKFIKPIFGFCCILFAIIPNYVHMGDAKKTIFEGAWDAVSVSNFSDTIPEKNKMLTLRMFVEGGIATIKKTYQYEDFNIGMMNNTLKLTSLSNTKAGTSDIAGNYILLNGDSLIFNGKDGTDSVHWVFKKTSN